MSLSISGAVSAHPAVTPSPAPAPAATKPATETPQSPDAVILSQSAQISQLNLQGQSPAEIAQYLGIPVSTVNSDLGIVAAAVTSKPATGTVAPSSTSAA